jgi:hypothetical protein
MRDLTPKASRPKKYFGEGYIKKTIGWWKERKRPAPDPEVQRIAQPAMGGFDTAPTGGSTVIHPVTYNMQVWTNWNLDTATTINTIPTQVWGTWNNVYHTNHVTAITNNTVIWQTWNGQTGAAPIIQVMTNVWEPWNEAYRQRPARHIVAATPEEIAAQRERERVARERWEAEEKARIAGQEIAKMKARQLLLEHLTPKQKEQYEKLAYFDLEIGGRIYRIRRGWSGNVQRIKKDEKGVDKMLESFCIHPSEWVPEEDNLLAQKLLLETSEEDFRKIANISRHVPEAELRC